MCTESLSGCIQSPWIQKGKVSLNITSFTLMKHYWSVEELETLAVDTKPRTSLWSALSREADEKGSSWQSALNGWDRATSQLHWYWNCFQGNTLRQITKQWEYWKETTLIKDSIFFNLDHSSESFTVSFNEKERPIFLSAVTFFLCSYKKNSSLLCFVESEQFLAWSAWLHWPNIHSLCSCVYSHVHLAAVYTAMYISQLCTEPSPLTPLCTWLAPSKK